VQKDKHFCIIYRVCPQKRRVHLSLIYRRNLIIYTPNEMVVNSLQKALNSHIALRALRIRCQNILIHIHTKKSQKTLLYSMFKPPAVKSTPRGSLFRLIIKKKNRNEIQ
jgi:hypothetical protein